MNHDRELCLDDREEESACFHGYVKRVCWYRFTRFCWYIAKSTSLIEEPVPDDDIAITLILKSTPVLGLGEPSLGGCGRIPGGGVELKPSETCLGETLAAVSVSGWTSSCLHDLHWLDPVVQGLLRS